MIIVKIDLATLRKNPYAGKDYIRVQGNRTIRFELEGGVLPSFMVGNPLVDVMEETFDGKFAGFFLNDEPIEQLTKLQEPYKWNLEVDNGIMEIPTMPQPLYLYEYENVVVKCSNCNEDVALENIETDYTDEGTRYETCPNCGDIDSFPEVQYETLDEALKRKDVTSKM